MGPHYLSIASEEHQSGLVEALENFLRSQALVDCTLAAEGQYLKAHKVILSARSPYFEMLFKQECEKNPILILKDVKFEYLKLVVDFVYHGEVHVLENQLNAFLDVAESLQIEGLDAYNKEPTPERTLPEPPETSPNVHETQDCKSGVYIIDDIDCGVLDKINSAEEIRVREQSSVYEQRDAEDGESPMMVTIQSTFSMAPCESPAPVAMMENEHEWPPDSPSPLSIASTNVKSEQLTESTETCSEMFTDEEDFMGFDCVPIEQQAVTQTNGAGSSSSERCQTPENGKPMEAITEDVTGTAKESCSSGSTTRTKQLYPCIHLQRMPWKNQGESSLEPFPTTPSASPTTAYSTVALQVPPRTKPEVNSAPSRILSNANRKGSKTSLKSSLVVSKSHPESPKQPKSKTSQRVHRYKTQHICRECYKQFASSSRLARHRIVHTGERPFICPICRKCFTRNDDLKRHRSVHTGEKPHLCKYCEKSFNRSETLKTHMRIHTGERPYPCGECGKKYPSTSALAQHKPVHEEIYKFTCDKCGKLFKWRSVMISHWFNKHEKKK